MNEPDLQELIDKAATGRLSGEEEKRWSALLAERPELEEELALAEALQALPAPPPVSSNFTALVMQELRRIESAPAESSRRSRFQWPRFARLTATAAIVFGIAITLRHQREIQRAEMAAQTISDGVKVITPALEIAPESLVTVFQDFDAIRRLPAMPVDEKLLAALRE
jgi:anti-sigma factor RsiW